MRKLLLAIPAVVLFMPACGQAVAVDMPAETHTPPPTAGSYTPPPIVLPTEPVDPPTTTAEPQADEFVVTHIEDGDTIEVDTGQRVRLIGIDAPENGVCGYQEAGLRLAELVRGQTVTLIPGAQDDVDKYGRLLRYVDFTYNGESGADAGAFLLMEGLAVPRYNSTDGYGFHERERIYFAAYDVGAQVRAEEGTVLPCDAPPIEETPADGNQHPPPPAAGPDLDCSDFDGPVDTSGGDPHDLDRDHDGVGCEAN